MRRHCSIQNGFPYFQFHNGDCESQANGRALINADRLINSYKDNNYTNKADSTDDEIKKIETKNHPKVQDFQSRHLNCEEISYHKSSSIE